MIFLLLLSTTLIVPGWRVVGRGLAWWAGIIELLLNIIVKIKVEYRGLKNIPKEGPLVFSGKHESTMDALSSCKVFPEATALAKSSLFFVPILGQLINKMGLIPVVRGRGTAHKTLPNIALFMTKTKRPLLVFPEGTRAKPGQLLPLKSGAYYIQKETKIPVYTGATNAGYFWPTRQFRMKSGTIIYEFHDSVKAGLTKKEFMVEIQERIIGRSDALRIEAQNKDYLNRSI